MTEQELLLAAVADKIRQCELSYMLTNTNFLSLTEQSYACAYCRKSGVKHLLYGGYPDAERAMLLFLPDYLSVDDVPTFFKENPEQEPIAYLRTDAQTGVYARSLTHRDYLGSLLALGIRREVLGDILVTPDGADILAQPSIADFILANYSQAGHTDLHVTQITKDALRVPTVRTEQVRESVPSERLDALLSAAFAISRTAAVEAIGRGLVFVSGNEAKKPDVRVVAGQVLVLRGNGKAVYDGIVGKTRKDRLAVTFTRYL